MRCQLAEGVQDRQEAGELAVDSAVDYPLPANRLRRNFHQSRRRLP